jgi:effector-binding domain-containing protein
MKSMPTIEERAAQPYVAIEATVSMDTISAIADRLSEVFGWLATEGGTQSGPPFFKYEIIDMARRLVIRVGVPVAEPLEGSGDILPGMLPAGRYATVSHVGHPQELMEVTRDLLVWAAAEGLTFDMEHRPDGEHWGSRLEFYLSDPREVLDMNKWETVLAFRLAS